MREAAVGALRALAAGSLLHQRTIVAAGAIEALVLCLGSSNVAVQKEAAGALGELAADNQANKQAIAAAGAIPALMQLLGSGSSAEVQATAAGALFWLAIGGMQNQEATAASIPALVRLLGTSSSAEVQKAAARALGILAADNPGNQETMFCAGAVPALLLLLEEISDWTVQSAAAAALLLSRLCSKTPVNQQAPSGALQPLVQLLGSNSSVVQEVAARALGDMAVDSPDTRQAIVAAHAIPRLTKLLDSNSPEVHSEAAATLELLPCTLSTHQPLR